MRVPQTAQLYLGAVRNFNDTHGKLLNDRNRALIAELLGGRVKIRQEGEAVYASKWMAAYCSG